MWTLQKELKAPGITIQIRTYHWPQQYESLEATQCPAAMMVLSRQPRAIGRYCPEGRGSRFVQIGATSFAPARVPMHWRTDGGVVQMLQCELDYERFETLTQRRGDWRAAELEASLDIREIFLSQTLSRLFGELASPGFAAGPLAEALGIELMVGLARYFGMIKGSDDPRGGRTGPLAIGRVTEYIDSCEFASPSISELAELCNVSRGYLMRAFKAQRGLTIHTYIEQVRFAKAKALLADSNLPIKEVAFRLGFSTQANFSAAFRKLAGEAPRLFRQRYRS